MRYLTIFIICLFLSNKKIISQIPKDSIIGKWQLIALQGKQVSDHELLQRYEFLSDGEYFYTSRKRTLKGKYSLEPKTGKMSWELEKGQVIFFEVKLESNGTLILKQSNQPGAPGILSRIK